MVPTKGMIKIPLVVRVPVIIGSIPHTEAFEKLNKGSQDINGHILPEDIMAKYQGIPEPKIAQDTKGSKRIYYP